MPKKKQISIETIEYMQRTINDLLESEIQQSESNRIYGSLAMFRLTRIRLES